MLSLRMMGNYFFNRYRVTIHQAQRSEVKVQQLVMAKSRNVNPKLSTRTILFKMTKSYSSVTTEGDNQLCKNTPRLAPILDFSSRYHNYTYAQH